MGTRDRKEGDIKVFELRRGFSGIWYVEKRQTSE